MAESFSKLELGSIATTLAAKLKDPCSYAQQEEITGKNLLEKGWKILFKSSDNPELSQYGYKAVALSNDKGEVHIATAGTDICNLHDLSDDGLLILRLIPNKKAPAQIMVDKIIDSLGGIDKAKDYKFSTSGHSLGAVMSDLTATDILSRGLTFTESITFENPGSQPAVERYIEQLKKSQTTPQTLTTENVAKHCQVYNNIKPNMVNHAFPQLGAVSLVAPSNSLKSESPKNQITSKDPFSSYLLKKVGSAFASCAEYLGIKKLLEEHALKNFENTEASTIIDSENWSKVDKKILVTHPLNLDKITSTGDDVIELTEKEDEEQEAVVISSQTYSYDDLSRTPGTPVEESDACDWDIVS
jgi:Lipase (class 3)